MSPDFGVRNHRVEAEGARLVYERDPATWEGLRKSLELRT